MAAIGIVEALALGVLQGVTEWLPVSSSGHLALAQIFFGVNAPVAFDVALHLGTLIAVIAFFSRELAGIATGIASLDAKNEGARLAVLIILASVPTAIIGFAFKKFFESMFSNAFLVGIAFLVTAAFLFIAWLASKANAGDKKIGSFEAIVTGIAQGISVAPGISRSGATISAALLSGVGKREAAEFSFMIAIPAVLGASLFELGGAETAEIPLAPLAAGVLAAALVGFLSIGFLIRKIEENKLHYFAFYCLALGLAAIAFSPLFR